MASWSKAPADPFGLATERIPLRPDLLVKVVAQVRFAPILSVSEQGFIAPFQEAIRITYPQVRKEMQQQATVEAGGELKMEESVLWRFVDMDDNWKVSLSDGFVALDCGVYSDRANFLERLRVVLDALEEFIRPVTTSRVGVRYTDRVTGSEMIGRLRDFIRPELLGVASTEFRGGDVLSHLTRSEFLTEGVSVRGFWGHLPAHSTHDVLIDAIKEPSWVLDLDAYTTMQAPFDAALCVKEAERYAKVVYRFFRWAVSDEFLKAYEVKS